MVDFPSFFPTGFLPILLLLRMPTWCSAVSKFSVKGPTQPILVLLGADASLPCQLFPEQSAAHMQIRWYRAQFSPAVLVYQDGQEQGGEQMLEYRGRTELVEDAIGKGTVTLLIQQIRTSDDGQYRCHFKDGHISQEATVELHVIGLGAAPHVHMTGPEDDGIRVLCSSGGWFPKPSVQWSDMAGVMLPSLSESQTQDGEGLFRVEASLVVTDSSLGNVTCSFLNPLSGQERVSVIFLPEPFFPRASPWKRALAGTLPVLVLLLIGISYFGWREHKARERAVMERKKESQEKTMMSRDKELALAAKGKSGQIGDSLKSHWKKALLYPALVTLNHENSYESNSDPVQEENSRKEAPAVLLSNRQRDCNLIILNQEEFTSGRHYWEVDIEDTDEWTLGICEKPTEKKGELNDLPKRTFRVLEKKGCHCRALVCLNQDIFQKGLVPIKKGPQKIVIFLAYEDSDVSFYNMTDGTHIYSFTHCGFSGSISPYFKLKSYCTNLSDLEEEPINHEDSSPFSVNSETPVLEYPQDH
uniref:Butyrophilin-like protein 1 n=1 Tax=Catagonus wagneri TaxID=51154 RepID=A0A8C3X196_9CETA